MEASLAVLKAQSGLLDLSFDSAGQELGKSGWATSVAKSTHRVAMSHCTMCALSKVHHSYSKK